MNPILTNIHNDITYLSFLDYVDIKSLCNSSKQLSYIIKNNEILRSILYNKNKNIEITPNFDISSALKDIYGSIQKIIDANYPRKSLPRFVNEKLFNDDILRKLMDDFIDIIIDQILDAYSDDNQPYRQIIKVELFNGSIASILSPDNIGYEDFDHLKIPNTIIIPESFWDYSIPTINNAGKLAKRFRSDKNDKEYHYLDYHTMIKTISDLLFVK